VQLRPDASGFRAPCRLETCATCLGRIPVLCIVLVLLLVLDPAYFRLRGRRREGGGFGCSV